MGLSNKRLVREAERRHQGFIEFNVEGAWRLDLDKPISTDLPITEQVELLYQYAYFGEANEALAQQYGFEGVSEVLGLRLAEFMPIDLPTSISTLTQWVENNYTVKAVVSVERDKHGNEKRFLNNSIGEIENGMLLRVWGTAKDITREKQLEEEVHWRSAMVEQLQEGCVITEIYPEKIIYVNNAFTQMTGYTLNTMPSEKLSLLQGPDTSMATVSKIREAITNGLPFEGDILNYKRDGTPFWNHMRISPLRSGDGEIRHFMGVFSDVTEDLLLRQRLQDQRNQLRHISRVATLGEMAATLAHELNQPFTAILSNAQAAQHYSKREPSDIDKIQNSLRSIVDDTKRGAALLRSIRDQVDSDPREYEVVQLNTIIKDTNELLKEYLGDHEVEVVMQLESELPPSMGDPVRLQQVIINLMINATEAMKEQGTNDKCIKLVSKSKDNQEVIIEITDTGPGIDEQQLHKIFQTFFSTKKEGMGMGLAISNSIIKAHDGRIEVANNPDQGVTFSLLLPLVS